MSSRDTARRSDKLVVDKLLNQAWDELGGVSGTQTLSDQKATAAASERADRLIAEAEALAPNDADVCRVRGVYYSTIGRTQDAEAAYKHAIALAPHRGPAYSALGCCLFEQGKVREAEESVREAIKHDAKLAIAHADFGRVLYAQNRANEAIASYMRSFELNSSLLIARLRLCTILYEQGRPADALPHCVEASHLDPSSARAFNIAGVIYLERGDLALAEDEFRKAIAAAPDFQVARSNLGLALMRQGRSDEAQNLVSGSASLLS